MSLGGLISCDWQSSAEGETILQHFYNPQTSGRKVMGTQLLYSELMVPTKRVCKKKKNLCKFQEYWKILIWLPAQNRCRTRSWLLENLELGRPQQQLALLGPVVKLLTQKPTGFRSQIYSGLLKCGIKSSCSNCSFGTPVTEV